MGLAVSVSLGGPLKGLRLLERGLGLIQGSFRADPYNVCACLTMCSGSQLRVLVRRIPLLGSIVGALDFSKLPRTSIKGLMVLLDGP